MSTNCISCIKNERTELDLLCDECRIKEQLEFLFKFFMLGYQAAINTLINSKPLVKTGKTTAMREYFEKEAKKQGLI